MADHWVSEVFTPKFGFKTVNDLLEKESFEFDKSPKESRSCQSYNKVYKDIVEQENAIERPIQLDVQEEEKVSDKVSDKEVTSKAVQSKERKEKECIWTEDELKILRRSFQKLKVQNVYMAGMVDSLQQELHTCKKKQGVISNSHSLLREKWTELKKRYNRAKISCKSLKEDLKSYHSSLKTAREDVDTLQADRSFILKDLNAIKVELDSEKLKASQLMAKLEEKEAEKTKALQHCEFVTSEQCKFEETLLKKEIFQLKEDLKRQKDENSINKRSLENLRNHFVAFKLNEENQFKEGDILNIADIDYTP